MFIGERLADIRNDHGDTQLQLAKKLGTSVSAIRNWEQGKCDPTTDNLYKMCKLYGVKSDFLIGLSDEDPLFEKEKGQEQDNGNIYELSREELEVFILREYDAIVRLIKGSKK